MSGKCFHAKTSINLNECKCTCSARYMVEENKRKFEIIELNDISKLEKYKIDGCLIFEFDREKCDYMFTYDNLRFLFVELKGSDIEKAYNQIISTIDEVKRVKDVSSLKGFIVSSRVPMPQILRKLKINFQNRYKLEGGFLFSKNNHLKYSPLKDKIS